MSIRIFIIYYLPVSDCTNIDIISFDIVTCNIIVTMNCKHQIFLKKFKKLINMEPLHRSGWKVVQCSCNGLGLKPVPEKLSFEQEQFLAYYWCHNIFQKSFPKSECAYCNLKFVVLPK